MAKHLTEMGENIALLSHTRHDVQGDEDFDRSCGYPVVRFNTKIGTGGWYRDPWGRSRLLTTLLKEAQRINADYIIYNSWGGSPLFQASLQMAARILRIPAFVYIHARSRLPQAMSSLQGYIFNRLLRSAAGVFTVCHYDVSALARYKVRAERVHVVHNGFDLQEADSYLHKRSASSFSHLDTALPIGRPNILCVARLASDKRIDRLIRVMPRIMASVPDARLAIAGIGDEGEQLRQLVADSPARDSITMLGLVYGDEKFECFARCALFALPSENEGFPLVLVEAGAFGKPHCGYCRWRCARGRCKWSFRTRSSAWQQHCVGKCHYSAA